MKKIASAIIAGTLMVGPAACLAEQDKNPNQQQQQASPKNQPPPDNPGQNTPSPSNPDIPTDKPGTNNPDIAPDSKPATPGTAPEGKSKKTRRRKQTPSSTQTGSTHTAPTS